jgi:hypothetical protein
MAQELIAWMPTEHEDLETAQYLLAIQIPKGRVLDRTMFMNNWGWGLQSMAERSGNLEEVTEHLASKLESLGLLPEGVDAESLEQMLDPDTNPRIADLLRAWGIADMVPNKPLTEINKEAEKLIQERDSSTWVDSLRYP